MPNLNLNVKKTVNNKNDNRPIIFVVIVVAFIILVSLMMAINDIDSSLNFIEKLVSVFWSALTNFVWGIGIAIFLTIVFLIYDYFSKRSDH